MLNLSIYPYKPCSLNLPVVTNERPGIASSDQWESAAAGWAQDRLQVRADHLMWSAFMAWTDSAKALVLYGQISHVLCWDLNWNTNFTKNFTNGGFLGHSRVSNGRSLKTPSRWEPSDYSLEKLWISLETSRWGRRDLKDANKKLEFIKFTH